MSNLNVRLRKYKQHRKSAKQRGIPWLFTYVSWSRIWMESGHYHERGCHKGQYVMSRPGDKGPYATYNVKIVQVGYNHSEKKMSKEARTKISRSMMGNQRGLGHINSAEMRVKISKRMMGNKYGKGKLGYICSPETIQNMIKAQKTRRACEEKS